jgi:hypothetical protein
LLRYVGINFELTGWVGGWLAGLGR